MGTVTTLPRGRPLTADDHTQPLRPLLAVEILSPNTRHVDLSLKRARYEAADCPTYWVVDPDTLELTAWELHEHAYVEVAHVTGDAPYAATHPLPVEVVSAELVR